MTGSIRKRQKNKNGTYAYQLRVMVNGTNYVKTVRCLTDAEANKELAKFYAQCEAGIEDSSHITWPDLCDRWLNDYASIQHKKSTYHSEKTKVENRIKLIWKKQARKITRRDVQAWINRISEEKPHNRSEEALSGKTVQNYYGIVRQIFEWAVKKEYLASTPCQYIDLPKVRKKEAAYLDIDTFTKALKLVQMEPLHYQAAFYLAVFGGFRKGELLGLKWDDVDLDTGAYRIRANRLYDYESKERGATYEDTPKTENSSRRGVLPEMAVDILKTLKASQSENETAYGDAYTRSGYILRHEDGRPIAPASLANWLTRFRGKNDLPHFTLHSLRHTHASLMRYLGADIGEIQKKLGHADKSTTENIYVHLFEQFETLDRRMATEINEFVKRNM